MWVHLHEPSSTSWCFKSDGGHFYTRRFSNRIGKKRPFWLQNEIQQWRKFKVVSPQVAIGLHLIRVKQESRLASRFRIPCFDWLQTYCVTQIEWINWSLHSWKHVELWSVCFASSVSDCTLMSFHSLSIFLSSTPNQNSSQCVHTSVTHIRCVCDGLSESMSLTVHYLLGFKLLHTVDSY